MSEVMHQVHLHVHRVLQAQRDSIRNVRSDAPSSSSRATGSSTQNNTPNSAPLSRISSMESIRSNNSDSSVQVTGVFSAEPWRYAPAINSERPPANNDLLSPPVGTRSGDDFHWDNLMGKYVVDDPNNLAVRGYINPATGQPYLGFCQPYAGNLSRVMDSYRKHEGAMQFDSFREQDKN